jgi:1,4-alpha-glucan branching enzyme
MIERKSLSKGNKVSVTFSVPADLVQDSVSVVGDFNEWDDSAHPLKLSKKDGVWKKAVQLKPGRYEFRYFVDGERWENESDADDHVWSPFFSQNSVVVIEE